jgi:hypothetical protein
MMNGGKALAFAQQIQASIVQEFLFIARFLTLTSMTYYIS